MDTLLKMCAPECEEDYIEMLCAYALAFMKKSMFMKQAQFEVLSTLLTPSDEAFLILCVYVYSQKLIDDDSLHTSVSDCCS